MNQIYANKEERPWRLKVFTQSISNLTNIILQHDILKLPFQQLMSILERDKHLPKGCKKYLVLTHGRCNVFLGACNLLWMLKTFIYNQFMLIQIYHESCRIFCKQKLTECDICYQLFERSLLDFYDNVIYSLWSTIQGDACTSRS